MRPRAWAGVVEACLVAASTLGSLPVTARPATSDDAVPGLAAGEVAAAYRTFVATCPVVLAELSRRPGSPSSPELSSICRDALAVGDLAPDDAVRFFATRFTAVILPEPGLLTGYYEPELEGALASSPDYPTPLLAMPDPVPAEWPDRAAIENGALGATARPVAYLRDPVDAFVVHIQGSARLRLTDGQVVRVAYAGRNGQPYTGIARLLAERLGIAPSQMDADRLSAWLRRNPEEGRTLMRRNRSYIFFRRADELDPAAGPVGAAGLQLEPGRSLAVDARIWPYGLPVRLTGTLPRPEGGDEPFDRLVIAQDTGSAIVGPGRGDLFVGSGPEAGRLAGLIRQRVGVTVLWPRGAAPPSLAP